MDFAAVKNRIGSSRRRSTQLILPCLLALAGLTTTFASGAYALPDLVPEISSPSVRVTNVGGGDVEEGCAGGTLNRRLVRYTVAARNIGADDLVIGDPGCPNCVISPGAPCANPLYVCSTAHGHAHMESFIQADLRDLDGNLVAGGRKYSFCLGDVDCAAPKFNCSFQGISAGCADIYTADTPCQYIDITGLPIPAGTYVLHTTVDPDNVLAEADNANNTTESIIFIGPPPTCPMYIATDTPKAIPDLGSTTSTIAVSAEGEVTNVQVIDLHGNHPFVGDLEFRLTSPSATQVTFLNRICGSSDDFNLSLHDLAETLPPCPPTDAQSHTPANPLSAFDGEPANGTWTLTVFDRAGANAGSLQGWGLALCTQSTCPMFPSASVPRLVPNPGSVASALTVPVDGRVIDVNVVSLTATHAAAGDLELHLVSPEGTDVVAVDRVCGNSANLDLSLDDAAASAIQCPANNGASFRPSNPLSAFNGEEAAGTWTLVAIDRSAANNGVLTGWGLQVCTDSACGTYAATTLPLTIPDLGSLQASVNIPIDANVTDVNVINLAGSHPQFSELQFHLTSPSGTDTLVAAAACSDAGPFAFALDDSAAAALACPPNDGLFHTPVNPLAVFDAEVAKGLWTLTAFDTQAQNWGDLSAFALQVCSDAALPTATPTPTVAQTPTPTQTAAAAFAAHGSAAVPGGVACVGTTLNANGLPVGQTSNELSVDALVLSLSACSISPVIGPGSAYDRQLVPIPAPGSVDVQVASNGNTLPLPGGVLHTCSYNVALNAAGTTAVGHQASAVAVGGAPLPTTASDAEVVITACSVDCNGDGQGSIGELVLCIGRFLGAPACDAVSGNHCPVADADHDGNVSIGEAARCVRQFLQDCI